MSFDYELIGNRIRKAREKKGLTQESLAETMDVSNTFVSKLERGRSPVNLENLDRICSTLETSAGYLLDGASKQDNDYMHHEIIDMLKGVPAEKIKLIAQVIRPIVEYRE